MARFEISEEEEDAMAQMSKTDVSDNQDVFHMSTFWSVFIIHLSVYMGLGPQLTAFVVMAING